MARWSPPVSSALQRPAPPARRTGPAPVARRAGPAPVAPRTYPAPVAPRTGPREHPVDPGARARQRVAGAADGVADPALRLAARSAAPGADHRVLHGDVAAGARRLARLSHARAAAAAALARRLASRLHLLGDPARPAILPDAQHRRLPDRRIRHGACASAVDQEPRWPPARLASRELRGPARVARGEPRGQGSCVDAWRR